MTSQITMGDVATLAQKYGIIHVNGITAEHVGTWKIQRPDIPQNIKDYFNNREELNNEQNDTRRSVPAARQSYRTGIR